MYLLVYRYVEGVVSEMENTLLLSDFIDGVMDWREAKRADFVFFQVRMVHVDRMMRSHVEVTCCATGGGFPWGGLCGSDRFS